MDLLALKNEITLDPLALGYAQYLPASPGWVVNLINNVKYTKPGWISVAQFNTWCATHNAEYVNIQTLASNINSPFYAPANALLRTLTGITNEGAINTVDPIIQGLFTQWPFIDTTGAAKTALLNLGLVPASRADVLGLGRVTEYDLHLSGVV